MKRSPLLPAGLATRVLAIPLGGALLGGALLVVGCESPSCDELCQQARQCPEAASQADDCASDCERVRNRNSFTGCSDPYDDFLDCLASTGVCSPDPCREPQEAWFACTREGCSRNPGSEACER
jgi:hypothetical protein